VVGGGGPGVIRSAALPGARTLRIRLIAPDDEEALARLFAGLSEEDLYRRFFQAHVPAAQTVRAMVGVAGRGGVGLVAEVVEPDGKVALVGDATVEPLPNGDGELAVTVERRWRGWMGPYLLDTLVEVAAARGFPNLEADILAENRPMLATVRGRGFATMGHDACPSIVRVVIGATRRVPTWPREDARPRVLVEAPGGRWHAEAAARAAGFQVVVCPGPRPGTTQCPAMRGSPCPLAAAADVIVDDVPPEQGGGRLLEAHRALHRGVPVFLEPPPATRRSVVGKGRGARIDDDATAVAMLRRVVRRPPAGRGSTVVGGRGAVTQA
jgi:hypothetical protein